jgi:futalosine hydrolase
MNVYVAAATMLEIEPLIENIKSPAHKLIITGIGAAATAYILTKVIKEDKPDLVIQVGIAGAFDSNLTLGEVCMVSQDRFADLGVEENNRWLDIYDLGLASADDFPFKNGWLKNEKLASMNFGLSLVNAITINEVSTNSSRIRLLKAKYQPAIESMEGAALHFVCLQESVRFIQMRAVSNYIGERDKTKWQMQEAIANLNQQLMSMLDRVNSLF